MARSRDKSVFGLIISILLIALLFGRILSSFRKRNDDFDSTISKVTLSQNGYLSVDVVLALNESEMDENACLRVTYPNGEKERISLPCLTDKTYTVSVPVPIEYKNDKISAELLPKGMFVKVYKNFIFSDELERVMTNPDEYTVSQVKYAEAMDMCIRAVESVFYDVEAPTPTEAMEAVTADKLKEYAQSVKNEMTAIEILPIRLSVGYGANIDLYYEATEPMHCTVNGQVLESRETDEETYCVTKKDISAFNYDKTYTFFVYDVEVKCSVLSFVYAVLATEDLPEHWYTAVKSLYLLHEAAVGLL